MLDQLRQGEQAGLESMFKLHYEGLLNYGIKLTGDEEESRELIQELFLTIWQNRRSLDINTSLKSYLFSSIYHRALNRIRRQRIEEAYQKNQISTMINCSTPPPEVNPFLAEQLNRAIDQLPERSMQAFVQTQINELSYAETAKIMGISERTVENLLARARKILQKKIKKLLQ